MNSAHALRLVFWELTAGCNLRCQHCRAEAQAESVAGELSTDQILETAKQIRKAGDPIMILTGGEPLVRPDFFDIARFCSDTFSRVAIATNGTMVDNATALKLADSGIVRASVSIDGACSETHDAFRGLPGSFDDAISGLAALNRAGIGTQVNMTVTKSNVSELLDVMTLARNCKADAFHVFVLVPVGCGASIDQSIRLSPAEIESTLDLLLDKSIELKGKLHIKTTCAPQYYRIMKQRGILPAPGHSGGGMHAVTKGCLAGSAVCFVSRTGDVQPCGYLPVVAGNVLRTAFDEIWARSDLFSNLRDSEKLEGQCGACGFKEVCEGCRARAFAETGNYMAEDPDCVFCRN